MSGNLARRIGELERYSSPGGCRHCGRPLLSLTIASTEGPVLLVVSPCSNQHCPTYEKRKPEAAE